MLKTKTMLVCITTFVITLLIVNTIVWYLTDIITFKQSFSHGATIFTMLLIGWIPAVIVADDYYHRI
jgi:uncharacterized membrane protein required for colicin V production